MRLGWVNPRGAGGEGGLAEDGFDGSGSARLAFLGKDVCRGDGGNLDRHADWPGPALLGAGHLLYRGAAADRGDAVEGGLPAFRYAGWAERRSCPAAEPGQRARDPDRGDG